MKIFSLIIMLFSISLLVACKTIDTVEPVKALLVNMDNSTKLQITKFVSDSMDGKSVNIDESVFSLTNRMTITTNAKGELEGNPMSGLILDMPQNFQLILRGTVCYIVHEETGTEYELANVSCMPM